MTLKEEIIPEFQKILLEFCIYIQNDSQVREQNKYNPRNFDRTPKIKEYSDRIIQLFAQYDHSTEIFYSYLLRYTPPLDLEQQSERMLIRFQHYVVVVLEMERPTPSVETIVERFFDKTLRGETSIALWPIFNLNTRQPVSYKIPFKISDEASFGELDSETAALFENEARTSSLYKQHFDNYGMPKFFIKTEVPVDNFPKSVDEIFQCFNILFYAFNNLITETPCSFHGLSSAWLAWDSGGGSSYPGETEFNPPGGQITGSELDDLLSFFERTDKKDILRYKTTYRRILQSYKKEEHYLIEDKVIDISIALETLFEGNSNIVNKLTTITPILIATDYEERIKISKLIGDFYEYRSRIVHGDEQRKYFHLGSVDTVRGYVQKLLKSLLLNPHLRGKQKELFFNTDLKICANLNEYLTKR